MKSGKISESTLFRSVLSQLTVNREEIKNGAGVGEDCAIFDYSGDLLASCVCEGSFWEEDQITDGEQIFMYRLVTKCVNNLASAGAEPVAVMFGLLLQPQVEEPQIKKLMAAAQSVCGKYHMQIAGGHTFVTEAVKVPCITAVGYGRRVNNSSLLKPVCEGQDIVISKWIGLEGTYITAGKRKESLLKRYPLFLVEEAIAMHRYLSVLPEAAVALKSGVCAMHDASEGGIFAALWELAERAGVGLSVDLKKLPIRQETVEVCEYCGLNPYELLSGGALIMVTEDGPGLVQSLREEQIPASIVGRITKGRDRIVRNQEEVRYLERPRTDEIYKIYGQNAMDAR